MEARIDALQREAQSLAGSARTLVGELRALEIERDLRAAEVSRAEATLAVTTRDIAAATSRLSRLEAERQQQLRGLRVQLVDMYKRGAAGYLPLLLAANDLRQFGRTSRALAALGERNRRQVAAHRETMETLQRERAALEDKDKTLRAQQAAARQARADAERAIAARSARIRDIDARRDLTARYVGELEAARESLVQQLSARPDRSGGGSSIPMAPFRGALEWPVTGRMSSTFGQSTNRLGGSAVRNGVEFTAPLGTPVKAIHGGTVAHAAPFTGLGMLVIVDHGGNQYSLYGYLGAAAVAVGQAVEPGTELGQVGASPAGPPALYFEMRIDGRSVDPVQWLDTRSQ